MSSAVLSLISGLLGWPGGQALGGTCGGYVEQHEEASQPPTLVGRDLDQETKQ